MVVIDDENVYGQNFYVCYTTEMKEQELAKYVSAVAATVEGGVVGEDGPPIEEEKEDEVNNEISSQFHIILCCCAAYFPSLFRCRTSCCRPAPGPAKAAKRKWNRS